MDIETLYREEWQDLFNFFKTKGMKDSTAEDLIQDIFVYLIEREEEYDPERGSARMWVWCLANMWAKKGRPKKNAPVQVDAEIDYVEDSAPSPEDVVEMRDDILNTMDDVSKIKNAKTRRALRLLFTDQGSYKDVARIVGVSEGYVRNAAHQYRRGLINK